MIALKVVALAAVIAFFLWAYFKLVSFTVREWKKVMTDEGNDKVPRSAKRGGD